MRALRRRRVIVATLASVAILALAGGAAVAAPVMLRRGSLHRTCPVPGIGGSRSAWTGDTLYWNWAPHAIASLMLTGWYDNLAYATHVATALRTYVDNPVRMPFTVPAQSGVLLTGAISDHRFGHWVWTIDFGRDNPIDAVPVTTRPSRRRTRTSRPIHHSDQLPPVAPVQRPTGR
jgi:hypothetical protein